MDDAAWRVCLGRYVCSRAGGCPCAWLSVCVCACVRCGVPPPVERVAVVLGRLVAAVGRGGRACGMVLYARLPETE